MAVYLNVIGRYMVKLFTTGKDSIVSARPDSILFLLASGIINMSWSGVLSRVGYAQHCAIYKQVFLLYSI